jgi:hypothetical protein
MRALLVMTIPETTIGHKFVLKMILGGSLAVELEIAH